MKKIFVSMVAFLLATYCLYAQKGTNKLMLGADVGIPTGDFGDGAKVGPGVMAKLLFGVSPAGQITATSGVTFYKLKEDLGIEDLKVTMYIIPILGGYRHNFSGFYIEPQLGLGIFGARAKYQGNSESDSDNAFAWAMGMGYAKNKIDFGIRYQSMEKDDESLSVVGIHLGYILDLSGKK